MPRLAWATDVHFEFCSQKQIDAFADSVRGAAPDALLLAGDTATAPSLATALKLLEARVPCPIYFVLGNHDFYGGGLGAVRGAIVTLTERRHSLRWLPTASVVSLSSTTALVGVDGWADGRYGDYWGSGVRLNDFRRIVELTQLDRAAAFESLNRLGDAEASLLRLQLAQAVERHGRVVVVTHVPPFREAAWHEGQASGPDYAPFFACRATGEVLLTFAGEHPAVDFLVLCGHTHGAGEYQPMPNLRVVTGGAIYGDPKLQDLITVP